MGVEIQDIRLEKANAHSNVYNVLYFNMFGLLHSGIQPKLKSSSCKAEPETV